MQSREASDKRVAAVCRLSCVLLICSTWAAAEASSLRSLNSTAPTCSLNYSMALLNDSSSIGAVLLEMSVEMDLRGFDVQDLAACPSATGSYFELDYGRFVSNVRFLPSDSLTSAAGEWCIMLRQHSNESFPPITTWSFPASCPKPRTGRLQYRVNLSHQELELASEGQLVSSSHITRSHVLISMYGAILFPRLDDDGLRNCRAILSTVSVAEFHEDWIVKVPRYFPQGTWTSVFDVVDCPVIVAEAKHFEDLSVSSGQRFWVFFDTLVIPPFAYQLHQAVAHASMGLALSGLLDLAATYHVVWELVKPSEQTGWAMEHGYSFQAMDNHSALYTNITIDYQAIHHETHSHFIPRMLFTDALQPARQLLGERSGFVFFAEGWAQYLAFQFLARAHVYTTREIVTALVERFVPSIVHHAKEVASRNMTLIDLSREMYSNQTLWFYMFSAGALVALWCDFVNDAALASELVSLMGSGIFYPDGIPEATFEYVLQNESGLVQIPVIFQTYVRSSQSIPLEQWVLDALGVNITSRSPLNFTYLPDEDVPHATARFRQSGFPGKE